MCVCVTILLFNTDSNELSIPSPLFLLRVSSLLSVAVVGCLLCLLMLTMGCVVYCVVYELQMIKSLDTDHNGTISREELAEIAH